MGLALALVTSPALAQTSSAATWFAVMEREASAWAVSVKQVALAANQTGEADVRSKQQLATAIGAIDMSGRLMHATVDYHPGFGHPVSSKCAAQQRGKLHVQAQSERDSNTKALMTWLSSTRITSPAVLERDLRAVHGQSYCSASEGRMGVCTPSQNGMQAWDSNYGGAFSERTLSPEGEAAALAYVAMVADPRAPLQNACRTTACATAQARQLSSAAVAGMAAASIIGQVTDRRQSITVGQ